MVVITETILSVLFAIGEFLIGLLPQWTVNIFDGSAAMGTLLAYGLYFFPMDLWLFVIGEAVIMMTVTIAYTIAEWTWKKIPGIN